jgi:O-acetyl-ADP-ribose deacetylase (regulator of RNase III)
MEFKTGKGIISIIQGDITEQETDAIVNAANNHLWMGAGVAGAIKRKGGQIIEDEAIAQGPIEVGGAVITTAGKLKAKKVIHAAGMGQDLTTDENKIKKCTRASLELADKNKLQSISFPAIGTGVGGFPVELCAKIMINEAVEFLQNAKNLNRVVFVLFDTKTYNIFTGVLKNISLENKKN